MVRIIAATKTKEAIAEKTAPPLSKQNTIMNKTRIIPMAEIMIPRVLFFAKVLSLNCSSSSIVSIGLWFVCIAAKSITSLIFP